MPAGTDYELSFLSGTRHRNMTASTRHTLLSGILRVFFQDHSWF